MSDLWSCGVTRRFLLLLFTSIFGSTLASADDASRLEKLRPFLAEHCVDCHGPKRQKNDLRFDTLGVDLSSRVTLEVWQSILDQLNLGAMPPRKRTQPDAKEVAVVVETLTGELREAYAKLKSTGLQTVLRRLNRIELRNTLRDLLSLDGPDFRGGVAKLVDQSGNGHAQRYSRDPVRDFPADDREEGFDNIGQQLVMSDFFLKLVIGAVEECLERATHDEMRPQIEPRRFAGHIRKSGPGQGIERWARDVFPEADTIFTRYREPGAATGDIGRVSPDRVARRGVGVSARYRITIEASAHNQKHSWGKLLKTNQDEPLRLGLHLADSRRGGMGESNPTCRKVAEWEMPGDGSKNAYVYETWLDATWLPWIGWENAPYDRSLRPSKLVKEYYPKLLEPEVDKKGRKRATPIWEPTMARLLLEKGYRGPFVRVHSMTIEPLIEDWPPKSHVFLYGRGGNEDAAVLLQRFASRAFRRPVEIDELQAYGRLFDERIAAGAKQDEALRVAYTAVLASPRFLYLEESPGRLDSYAVASRLSYFLWSSMLDEELFRLAKEDRLRDPEVVAKQVERMLAHRSSEAFVRRFLERWLRLDKLGSMPPEKGGPFRFYWDRQMEPQLVAQTSAFFAHILKTNGPIRDFIDSDYTFLNERVAEWFYGRKDVWGDGFRKVPTNDPRRGGILTQPALMTATSNGVDTSPVVRGVWVLENILGTPPAPPPPDVEPLSPDLRGAKTIREQLERHREIDACRSCHQKIDPMGFALESFDPIGRWRDVYPKTRAKIDTKTRFPNGTEVDDIIGFKKLLLTRERDVVRCLTEKLLTYASGRRLEPSDRGEVERIVDEIEKKGNRLRDLIHLVVRSEIFLTK